MNKFLKNIDNQLEFNKGKNIFVNDPAMSLKFVQDTLTAIADIPEINLDTENLLIDYTTDKVLEEFCRINQYFTFNSHGNCLLCITIYF